MRVPGKLDGQKLDAVIEILVDGVTRSRAQKLVRKGSVRVNGKRVLRSNGRVRKGDEVTVDVPDEAPIVDVLFEDDALLVVHKPAGLLTHDADRARGPSLASLLSASHGPLALSRGVERPGVVHRLDRATSGVMVFARTDSVLDALQDQFRARTVEKIYTALVSGVPQSTTFSVDAPLGPVPGKSDRQQIDALAGKPATTDFTVEQAFASHALLHCTLHTGRRHQIRVHLANLGHPVVGDPLYGTKSVRPVPGIDAAPLMLHASRLSFEHPSTGQRMSFDSTLSPTQQRVLEALTRP